MADMEYVELLRQGPSTWNRWRLGNPNTRPDLSQANLTEAYLSEADLSGLNLVRADLSWANLSRANLSQADLSQANLRRANLTRANLSQADLIEAYLRGTTLVEADLSETNLGGADFSRANLNRAYLREANLIEVDLSEAVLARADLRRTTLGGANLIGADLTEVNLSGADLRSADLRWVDLHGATLIESDLTDADLTFCRIYGISAWGLRLEGAKQQNLIITTRGEAEITIDNIEVAQFVYLLLHNKKIRNVINTITSKVVLILGRFTEDRKKVLEVLRDKLRKRNYLPILFDFEKPASRDITETIALLARMARFVLADITDARSIPQELSIIVPDLPSVPVQPLLLKGCAEYSMFEHFRRYPWVLPLYRYDTQDQLIAELAERVIEPAERKAVELQTGTK